jgi:hypothetical protein
MSWWKSPMTFPLRIFLVALILRLMPTFVMRDMGIGLDDMYQYDMLARSIAAGTGYRWYAEVDLPTVLPYLHLDLTSNSYDPRGVLTSFRPPLYPTFLSLVYFVFGTGGNRFFIARLLQTLLAAAIAPMTYLMGRRLFPNKEPSARISAWIITVYPMLVIYPLSLATENLFFVLCLGSLLALLIAKDKLEPSKVEEKRFIPFLIRSRWFIFAGFLLGLTCLTRSVAQILSVFAAGWVWFILHERRRALLVLMTAALVVAPWVVRNSLLYRQFTGIESALGYDLYLGYHPQGTGTFQYPQSLDLMTMMNDAERDNIGIKKAIEFISDDPGRVLTLFLHRASYFFGLERRALTYFYSNNFFGFIPAPLLAGIFALFCLPFMLISTIGVAGMGTIQWNKKTLLIPLFFGGYITPHLLIIAEDRFHLATIPFVAVLASFFWTEGWNSIRLRWTGSITGKIALILSSAVILLLLATWGWELLRDADKLAILFGPNGNQAYFSY